MGLLRILCLACLLIIAACTPKPDTSAWGTQAPVLEQPPSSELRILVIGGTSGIGLETVKLAVQRGHQVVATARRPERMTLTHQNLQTVKSDILDAQSVSTVTGNVDAVVVAIGIPPTREPVSLFSDGTANVLSAMAQHSVGRLVVITGIGAGDSRGHGGFFYDNILQRFLLKTIYEDKDRSEALVVKSATDWTIVRPGFLIDEPAAGRYRVVEDMAGVTAGDIARADVAHFILAALESGQYVQKTVLLTN